MTWTLHLLLSRGHCRASGVNDKLLFELERQLSVSHASHVILAQSATSATLHLLVCRVLPTVQLNKKEPVFHLEGH